MSRRLHELGGRVTKIAFPDCDHQGFIIKPLLDQNGMPLWDAEKINLADTIAIIMVVAED